MSPASLRLRLSMDVRRRFPAQPPEPLVTIPGVPAIVMHKVGRGGDEVWGSMRSRHRGSQGVCVWRGESVRKCEESLQGGR